MKNFAIQNCQFWSYTPQILRNRTKILHINNLRHKDLNKITNEPTFTYKMSFSIGDLFHQSFSRSVELGGKIGRRDAFQIKKFLCLFARCYVLLINKVRKCSCTCRRIFSHGFGFLPRNGVLFIKRVDYLGSKSLGRFSHTRRENCPFFSYIGVFLWWFLLLGLFVIAMWIYQKKPGHKIFTSNDRWNFLFESSISKFWVVNNYLILGFLFM